MQIARLPPREQTAAHEPTVRPLLRSIPLFHDLLGREGVTHVDAQVYGAIAAYVWLGVPVSYAEIASLTRDRSLRAKATRRRIARLEAAGVLRRDYDGERGAETVRFTLLGPSIEADDPPPDFG